MRTLRRSFFLLSLTSGLVGALALAPPVAYAKSKKSKGKKKKVALEKGMKVVTTEETSVMKKPSDEADELYEAKEGEELTVVSVSDDGEWVKVKDSEGAKGWVEADAVAPAEAAADEDDGEDEGDEDEAPPPKKKKKEKKEKKEKKKEVADAEDEGDDEGGEDGDAEDGDDEGEKKVAKGGDDAEDGDVEGSATVSAPGKVAITVGADLAMLARSQSFKSNSMTTVGQYELNNSTGALRIGGTVTKPFGKYLLGAEVSYLQTVFGEGVQPPDAMDPVLAWQDRILEIRAVGAMPLSNGKYWLAGRLGYHTEATKVDVSPDLKIPSESVKGFPLGAQLTAVGLTPKIDARVGVEYLISGKLTQTDGLKDGEESTVTQYVLFAAGTYKVKPNIDAILTYTLEYGSFSFTGASQREAAADEGKRTDVQHVVGIGIVYKR